jgi:hypothetical protein
MPEPKESLTDPVSEITAAVVDTINESDVFGAEEGSPQAAAPNFRNVEPTDNTLYVDVYPRTDDAESWYTTDTDRSDVQIAILIRQNLAAYSAERVAELKALTWAIRQLLRAAHPLTTLDGEYPVNLWKIQRAPLWAPELLRTSNPTFVAGLLITYRAEYEA